MRLTAVVQSPSRRRALAGRRSDGSMARAAAVPYSHSNPGSDAARGFAPVQASAGSVTSSRGEVLEKPNRADCQSKSATCQHPARLRSNSTGTQRRRDASARESRRRRGAFPCGAAHQKPPSGAHAACVTPPRQIEMSPTLTWSARFMRATVSGFTSPSASPTESDQSIESDRGGQPHGHGLTSPTGARRSWRAPGRRSRAPGPRRGPGRPTCGRTGPRGAGAAGQLPARVGR